MHVLLEYELLCNFIALLFLSSSSFLIWLFEKVAYDVELLIERSLNNSTSFGHEFFKSSLLHLLKTVLFGHELEAFHEFFLFSLGLFLFCLWNRWRIAFDERATDKTTLNWALSSCLSTKMIRTASWKWRIDGIALHVCHVLLTFLIVLLFLFDRLQVLNHTSINNATLNLPIVCNWFFLQGF